MHRYQLWLINYSEQLVAKIGESPDCPRVALSECARSFERIATPPPTRFTNNLIHSRLNERTCAGDELALERRLEAEFGAEAAVAAVVDEDVVRAERREAHAARVAGLRLRASLQRDKICCAV